jgi:hypothetical protein
MPEWEDKSLSAKSMGLEYGAPVRFGERKALAPADAAQVSEVLDLLAGKPHAIPRFMRTLDDNGVSDEFKRWAMSELERRIERKHGGDDAVDPSFAEELQRLAREFA